MKKLSTYVQKNEVAQVEDKPKNGIGKCEVYGCEREGHIKTNNWNCRYHFGKHGDKLAHITLMLRNHEAEINWYEKTLNFTGVDFDLGDVAKRAPHGMQVYEGEKFKDYRLRVSKHIESLLK